MTNIWAAENLIPAAQTYLCEADVKRIREKYRHFYSELRSIAVKGCRATPM
jgi:hypothetical protein